MIKKIDIKKQKYLLFVDTETIGSLYVAESVLPFEIGVKIYDLENDTIVKEKSYLVRKFLNNKYIMYSTFSANKYPEYLEKIKNDKRYKLMSVNEIFTDLTKIIKRYNVNIMVAHNGTFDKKAIDRLSNEFGVNNPMKKIDLLDTMEISKVITYSKDYTDYCLQHQEVLNEMKESCFITNSGRVRTTAQAIYSYIIGDPDFKEAHTGLEDIDIEIEIFKESLKKLGNTIVKLNTSPKWSDYAIVKED